MPQNHLAKEKSPYLLQHAHNPVNWYPWSPEAFQAAQEQKKPIFLSIGYATCHWCHVMEKESFEDEQVARYLNDTFISIKVDREERPDIDATYMSACQLLTGSGGWPLSIFMTASKMPFFAATYLPKHTRFGRTGLIDLCRHVKELWTQQKHRVLASAARITHNLDQAFQFEKDDTPDNTLLDQCYDQIKAGFDAENGGFGTAPKFPTAHRLQYLLRYHYRTGDQQALAMVEKTLQKMRAGGLWDHVGHGFHRYSTDQKWLVPHFEKMLYDQALHAVVYLEAYQITKNDFYTTVARQIFDYVLRDMTDDEGGFYSAEDADSEGEEGKFYVWSYEQWRRVLGAREARYWQRVFNIQEHGNFNDEVTGQKTGTNIPHLEKHLADWAHKRKVDPQEHAARWEKARLKLFEHRLKRIHPLKDDKILTDWNGLMIGALAYGARVLQEPRYRQAALDAARFVNRHLSTADGRLLHRYRLGEAAIQGYAGDYAYLIHGLLGLYEATFDPDLIQQAIDLQHSMLDDFWDQDGGGFYLTANQTRDLPKRPKELYDGALPSANSVALSNMLRLARLTGVARWEEHANALMQSCAGSVKAQPAAYTHFLIGVDFALNPGQEIVITGRKNAPDTEKLLSVLNVNYAPNHVALVKTEQNAKQVTQLAGFTDGLQLVKGQATAHICRGSACIDPTTDAKKLQRLLKPKYPPK